MVHIERKDYLDWLDTWRDKSVVKVITGIRRSGKSTLLSQYRQRLIDTGVDTRQIQTINFEDIDTEPLLDYKILYRHIKEHLCPQKKNYIFLDEVQMVKEYQKAVNSLTLRPDIDVYLTGSNAYMLSGEIATLLSGRYVELNILPLSFAEYNSAQSLSVEYSYRSYISETSFPYGLQLSGTDAIREYMSGLYNTIVLKDIVARRKLQDMDLLERIIRFLADNIGNMVSVKSIASNLVAGGRKVSDHTVESYLQSLMECYMFYRVNRYDVRGKQNLKVGQKYYICDLGFRNLLLGIRNNDLGRLLENIVYLELLRRGNQVMIGKMDSEEIDFVTFKSGVIVYYQVALTVRDQTTLERELKPLRQISDHFQKILLTFDNDPVVLHDGISQIYVLDWLAG